MMSKSKRRRIVRKNTEKKWSTITVLYKPQLLQAMKIRGYQKFDFITWNRSVPCKLVESSVASGFMLQKSKASPMRGRTERPF